MKKKDVIFCRKCGLPLWSKWNKGYDEKFSNFCNSACKKRYEGGSKTNKTEHSMEEPSLKTKHKDFFGQ